MKYCLRFLVLFTSLTLLQAPTNGLLAQWTNVTPLDGIGIDLFDIHFLDENVGFVVGQKQSTEAGFVFKTEDGGLTWTTQSFPFSHLTSIAFTDENNGIMAGYDGPPGTKIKWFRTEDQGKNWNLTSDPAYKGINQITFVNSTVGFAQGYGEAFGNTGVIFKTTDAGENWDVQSTGEGIYESIEFINQDTGFLALWNSGGDLLKTTDGGKTFKSVAKGTWMHDVEFANDKIGYATDGLSDKALLKSTDGGETWQKAYTFKTQVKELVVITEKIVYVAGKNGGIYKTKDGGTTWTEEATLVTATMRNVTLVGDFVFAVGSDGRVLKTRHDVDHPVSVLHPKSHSNSVSIFPNPAKPGTEIIVEGVEPSSELRIMDQLGRDCTPQLTVSNHDNKVEFIIPNLPVGVYSIWVNGKNESITKKVIVAQ